MSEAKSPRKFPEIQAEYQSVAAKAGHVQYQVFTLKKDLELLNQTLRDLNFEAAAAQKEAADEAAKAAQEAAKAAQEAPKTETAQ